jgi:hypothetical protein
MPSGNRLESWEGALRDMRQKRIIEPAVTCINIRLITDERDAHYLVYSYLSGELSAAAAPQILRLDYRRTRGRLRRPSLEVCRLDGRGA